MQNDPIEHMTFTLHYSVCIIISSRLILQELGFQAEQGTIHFTLKV